MKAVLQEIDLFRVGNALLNITVSTYVQSRIHHRRRHHHHRHQWYHHHYAFKNLGLVVHSLLNITIQRSLQFKFLADIS
jgi:hypothetical protein